MRVQLCGGNVAVTHQFLQGTDIRTILQQMHRKAVTQCVRGNFFLDIGSRLVVLKDLPEALAAHANTADIHKKRLLRRICQHSISNILKINAQSL